MSTTLFESTESGRRRSVFFVIGIVTAFLSFTAATSAYASSPANLSIAVLLVVLGTAAILFSVAINQGGLSTLYEG